MDLAIGIGDACIVEAERVSEYGHVISIDGETPSAPENLPRLLRRATMQDQAMAGENQLFSKTALRLCQEKIKEHRLDMRIVRVHYSLDRSHLTVTFTADERVDFRQLIHDLAAETHARVEMRQIGARDEAAICGGLATCGRVLCCAGWLKEFDNVHIRMAKSQGLSLNPVTLNGMCGRLKCCLRYEQACYQDMARGLPHEGCRVRCPAGQGCVLETRVLDRKVKVGLDDRRVMEFNAQDVFVLGNQPSNKDNRQP
jgi:cell fate regulator YaaT (PSP1 superfamily)